MNILKINKITECRLSPVVERADRQGRFREICDDL
jgi:hypothetical protein